MHWGQSSVSGLRFWKTSIHWRLFLILVAGFAPVLRSAAQCLPPPSGLIGWWAGDGNASNILGANNGTLAGGATATAAGFVGQGFTFNGTTAYVQVADAPILRPTNFTVETWVRFNSLNSTGAGGSPAGQQYIVFKQNTRSSYFEGIYLGKERTAGGDFFTFGVTSSGGSAVNVNSAPGIATNVWYHLAAVRGPNFIQLYVNGQFIGQATVTFPQNYGNFPLYFGQSGQSYWDHKLNGQLDEVSLYNRPLSSNEIVSLFSAGAAGKCKPGVGLTITSQPQSQTVVLGGNASFGFAATGTPPLGFQWRFDGTPIPGATATNLTLTNVQLTDAGNYSVVVTNASNSVTSSNAALTVLLPPAITADPQNATNVTGTITVFTATATGSAPLSYRWQLNGSNLNNGGRISGATTNSLTISNVQTGDAGNYRLVVTNSAGTAISLAASLTVNGPPAITSQPAGQTVIAGANVSFTVLATGTQPLTYQWLRGGVPLTDGGNVSGSTSAALSLSNVLLTDSGNFQVVISNIVSATNSQIAALVVNPPPVPPSITADPENATNVTGGTAVFSATATGSVPLVYRWQLNGSNLNNGGRISGATSNSLTITNVQPGDAGNYRLVVTNAVGNAISLPASLTVNGPPVISSQPAGQSVIVGTNVSFTVLATGTQPLSYQWLRNGLAMTDGGNISGSTSETLNLTNVQLTDSANFHVVISNIVSVTNSQVAALVVNPPPVPPSITTDPASHVVNAGTNVTFFVVADGTAPLSYQWRKNGTNIAGATGPALVLTNVQVAAAGNYQVVVTNIANSVTSIVASLTVNVQPSITAQPASTAVNPGSNATFSVTASGTAPLTYQWRFNGTNLAEGGQFEGTTGTTLSISNAQASNAGLYSAFITNIAGFATSANASLTVNVPGSCAPPATGMVGWWPGDGNATTLVGTNNGSLQGGATASAPGIVGPSFGFNGTSSFVSIPDSPAMRPTNLTVETWVRFASLNSTGLGGSPAGQQYIIFKQNTRSSFFEGIYLGKERVAGGDHFTFGVSSSGGVAVSVDSAPMIATNVWYHVAAVRGGNTIQLYVNGLLVAQTNVNFPQNYGTLPLYFGTTGQPFWDHKLNGQLDEPALYNRALASNEIAAIYAAGAGGKCKTPVPPAIVAHPTSQTLIVGGSATFTVVATGTAPLSYQWYKDGFILNNGGNVSGATNASLLLANLQSSDAGNFQVVVSNSISTVTSAVASLNTGVPPANDAFASAQNITGTSGSVNGNNANATKQNGEPNHAGNAGGPSVWYNWTAPSASPVTIDTAMGAFNTLLAVYTGNSVNNLTQLAANNDMNTNSTRSRVIFTPVAGTVYRIAVDGANGANGNLALRWIQASVPQPNMTIDASAVNPRIVTENFTASSCAVMEGLVATGTRRLIRFDTETLNEGNSNLVFGNPAGNPLFVFASCHAHYHFQNYMSYRLRNSSGGIAAVGLKVGFCILDVFRWSPSAPNNALYNCVNQGIQVGWGDLYDSTLDGQWVDITGVPDGNYTLELEANPLGIIQEANYADNISTVPISIGNPNAAPLNNSFANPQTLLGGFASVSGVTGNATKQSGEPDHAGNAGGHSVWYQWTAPTTKFVTIDTQGSSFNTLLAVYTGGSVSGLTLVSSNDDIGGGILQSKLTFSAVAGTLYRIAVDGFNNASGNLILTLNQTIQNDNFANCQFIGGPTGIAYGATAGATKEAGEPNHAGNAGGQSTWYCWTAPVSGNVTFETTGSTFNTLLAAYSGSSLANASLMASNNDIDSTNGNLQSRITFNATGLTMYHIAIDGHTNDSGGTTLAWNLVATGQLNLANFAAVTQPGGPRLTSRFLPEGEFQVTIAGQPNRRYRLEISCDMVNWVPSVATLADETGVAYFTDKTTMNANLVSAEGDPICGPGLVAGAAMPESRGRFYRAIAIPQN